MEDDPKDAPHDKPMDEFEWEEWMEKNDEMVDKYSALMDKYMDDPNRDDIIAKEMGWDKDEDDDGIERPWLKEFEESLDHSDDEVEEGDEWKVAAGIKEDSDIPDVEDDPLYQLSFSFSTDFIKWFDVLPERVHNDEQMQVAARHALIPAAKIAGASGGSGDDDDKDQLGMQLAIYKRGLAAANTTLAALTTAKEKNLFNDPSLSEFIKRATELRNALAVRIQEVRERFNSL
ncbi:MAG: hypothetical protein AB1728_13935 [Bacteroidota bacterium]